MLDNEIIQKNDENRFSKLTKQHSSSSLKNVGSLKKIILKKNFNEKINEANFLNLDAIAPDNTDSDENAGIYQLSAYVSDIYRYLRWKETQMCLAPDYLSGKKVTSSNRAKLLDWLIIVHQKFELLPETLHLSVRLLDQYLNNTDTSNRVLQLVGITCLWIASKFEEIYTPSVSDFVFVTADSFDKNEINECEKSIVSTLEFDLNPPTCLAFLKRAAKISKIGLTEYCLAKFAIEIVNISYDLLHYLPSHIGCASLYLARILKAYSDGQDVAKSSSNGEDFSDNIWNISVSFHTAYSEYDLFDLMLRISSEIETHCTKQPRSSVYNKYKREKVCSVSRMPVCTLARKIAENYVEYRREKLSCKPGKKVLGLIENLSLNPN
ncbi:MAG: G2/mitotic-specific cyclin-B1 [Paramarteilia canceri]